MIKLTTDDLHEVFLLIMRHSKKQRRHLPIIRRHLRSVLNVCKNVPEMHIDIYYSGVLIARKPHNKTKIVMDREWRREHPNEEFVYE